MRVIAGLYRGRRLAAPPGRQTRPTTNRDREALFSALSHQLDHFFVDLTVLDLFAGSGLLGLEALSRGAKHVTFVENDPRAARTIQENIATLSAQEETRCMRANALRLAPTIGPFDIAFSDAPYGQNHGLEALVNARKTGVTHGKTLCVLECSEAETAAVSSVSSEILWSRSRGGSAFSIFKIS